MPGDAIANAANIIILSPFGAHVLPGSQENAQADVWQRGCDVHNLARGLHALEHLRPECPGTVNGISPKRLDDAGGKETLPNRRGAISQIRNQAMVRDTTRPGFKPGS